MTGKGRNAERLTYACGMTASNTRKFCKFIFQRYYYQVVINLENRNFDVLVHETVFDEEFDRNVSFVERFGKDYIKYFQEYWGEVPGLKLIYYKGINTEQLED